jgi:hypothetical protein
VAACSLMLRLHQRGIGDWDLASVCGCALGPSGIACRVCQDVPQLDAVHPFCVAKPLLWPFLIACAPLMLQAVLVKVQWAWLRTLGPSSWLTGGCGCTSSSPDGKLVRSRRSRIRSGWQCTRAASTLERVPDERAASHHVDITWPTSRRCTNARYTWLAALAGSTRALLCCTCRTSTSVAPCSSP